MMIMMMIGNFIPGAGTAREAPAIRTVGPDVARAGRGRPRAAP
jgi:hypothetical protein